jgi:tRNA (guanine26-N2/guanine27-N2)-dimethyltransferase
MNKDAYASLKKNIAFNKIKANAINCSIQEFANTTDKKFDAIDLDPFGGATPYIFDLMKISHNGTQFMITVTDTAVLCGADYKACMRLYDARPMHNELCQEVGVRLLIGYVTRIAAQFNFGVDVIASFSYLHYMRIFVQLRHGSKPALESIKKLGYVYYCNKCLNRGYEAGAFPTQTCKLCGSPVDISGKVWIGNLYEKPMLESMKSQMLKSPKLYEQKSIDFIDEISKEIDIPLYYSISRLTKKLGIGSVSIVKLTEMLEQKGFVVSRTHMSPNSIKTNANVEIIKTCIKRISSM